MIQITVYRHILLMVQILVLPLVFLIGVKADKKFDSKSLRRQLEVEKNIESFFHVDEITTALTQGRHTFSVFEKHDTVQKPDGPFIDVSSLEALHSTETRYKFVKDKRLFSLDHQVSLESIRHVTESTIDHCNSHLGASAKVDDIILISKTGFDVVLKEGNIDTYVKEHLLTKPHSYNGFLLLRQIQEISHTTESMNGEAKCYTYSTEDVNPVELFETFTLKSNFTSPYDITPGRASNMKNPKFRTQGYVGCEDGFWSKPNYEGGLTSPHNIDFSNANAGGGSSRFTGVYSWAALCLRDTMSVIPNFNFNYNPATDSAIQSKIGIFSSDKNPLFSTKGITCTNCYSYIGAALVLTIEYSQTHGFGSNLQFSAGAGYKVDIDILDPQVEVAIEFDLYAVNISDVKLPLMSFQLIKGVSLSIGLGEFKGLFGGYGNATGHATFQMGYEANIGFGVTIDEGGVNVAQTKVFANKSPTWKELVPFKTKGFHVNAGLIAGLSVQMSLNSILSSSVELKLSPTVGYTKTRNLPPSFNFALRNNIGSRTLTLHPGDKLGVIMKYKNFDKLNPIICNFVLSTYSREVLMPSQQFNPQDESGTYQFPDWIVPWNYRLNTNTLWNISVQCSNVKSNPQVLLNTLSFHIYNQTRSIFNEKLNGIIFTVGSIVNLSWKTTSLAIVNVHDYYNLQRSQITCQYVSIYQVNMNSTSSNKDPDDLMRRFAYFRNYNLTNSNIISNIDKLYLLQPNVSNSGYATVSIRSNYNDMTEECYFVISCNAFDNLMGWSDGFFKVSYAPTAKPVFKPTIQSSTLPSTLPSSKPSITPSIQPSITPSNQPSTLPSTQLTITPSIQPTFSPSIRPSTLPSIFPTIAPSYLPSIQPSIAPSIRPSIAPSNQTSTLPSIQPSIQPSIMSTFSPLSSNAVVIGTIDTPTRNLNDVDQISTDSRNDLSIIDDDYVPLPYDSVSTHIRDLQNCENSEASLSMSVAIAFLFDGLSLLGFTLGGIKTPIASFDAVAYQEATCLGSDASTSVAPVAQPPTNGCFHDDTVITYNIVAIIMTCLFCVMLTYEDF